MTTDYPVEDWPCMLLKQYPLDKRWNSTWPKSKVFKFGYTKTMGGIKALFLDKAFDHSLETLQDYSFQQGEFNNANAEDRAFFDNILCHDYTFWLGNKSRELVEDFPLDPKVHDCLGHMKASYYDLYEVQRSNVFGAVILKSLTSGEKHAAWAGLGNRFKIGATVFVRLMPINFLLRFTDPWCEVLPEHKEGVLKELKGERAKFQSRFPQTSMQAFLKIAAYHVYESIVGRELRDALVEALPEDGEIGFAPRLYTYKFMHPAKAPPLSEWEGEDSHLVDETLLTKKLVKLTGLHPNIGEVIVTRQGKILEFLSFVDKPMTAFIETVDARVDKLKHTKSVRELGLHELYRSLRHTV